MGEVVPKSFIENADQGRSGACCQALFPRVGRLSLAPHAVAQAKKPVGHAMIRGQKKAPRYGLGCHLDIGKTLLRRAVETLQWCALSFRLSVVPAMAQHVVFDFDGTLADSEEVCFQLLNEIAGKHRYRQLARGELSALKMMPYPERLRHLGVPLAHVPFLAMEARRHYRRQVHTLRPFEGMREALLRLREAGIQLHVLSSNAVSSIRQFLVTHDLDLFETVSCERNFFGKHIGLRRFMRAHDLDQADVIYVADEVRDVEACRKIGLPIISVAWGFDPVVALALANPGRTADTPLDLVAQVEALVCRSASLSAALL
jgi:phosphoglycolate phosphatase